MDDITAIMNWMKQGVGGDGRESSEEAESGGGGEGLKLSITEGGKEGKSTAITSCRYLEERQERRSCLGNECRWI